MCALPSTPPIAVTLAMSKHAKKPSRPSRAADNSRLVESATTFWMLTTVTTLTCEIMTAISRAYVWFVDPDAAKMALLSGMLLFASLVLGCLALGLGVVVIRARKTPPPRSIIVGAMTIAIAPMIAALLSFLSGA